MITRVPLEAIQSNPFQTRAEIGDVTDLAASIRKHHYTRPETSGLLQVPPARLWDVGAGRPLRLEDLDPAEIHDLVRNNDLARVQLACGHRRYAAFSQLTRAGHLDYATFPVDLQDLNDQAMADIAWDENAQRKDLNPIEEAQALQRAIETFGYTQEQIGERWGLSRSTVANKLRLLQLPDDARRALWENQITERHGRVLLTAQNTSPSVYNEMADRLILPQRPQDAIAKARDLVGQYRRDQIETSSKGPQGTRCDACGGPLVDAWENIRLIPDGAHDADDLQWLCRDCYRTATGWQPPTVAQTEDTLDRTIRRNSISLAAGNFPTAEPIPGQGHDVRSATCAECPYHTADDDGAGRCLDRQCFDLKEHYHLSYQEALLLDRLRKAHPVPFVREFVKPGTPYLFRLRSGEEIDARLAAERCPTCEHARLQHMNFAHDYYCAVYDDLPFIWCCKHSSTYGACANRWRDEHRPQENARALQARQAKERALEHAHALFDRAAHALAHQLLAGNADVWRALVSSLQVPIQGGHPAGNGNDELAQFYAHNVALSILNARHDCEMIERDATDAESIERKLQSKFASWRLPFPAQLPGLDAIVDRLERMEQFLYDGDGAWLRDDLTDEQIAGNLGNVERLRAQILQLAGTNQISDQDYQRLENKALDLYGDLCVGAEDRGIYPETVSRETQPQ